MTLILTHPPFISQYVYSLVTLILTHPPFISVSSTSPHTVLSSRHSSLIFLTIHPRHSPPLSSISPITPLPPLIPLPLLPSLLSFLSVLPLIPLWPHPSPVIPLPLYHFPSTSLPSPPLLVNDWCRDKEGERGGESFRGKGEGKIRRDSVQDGGRGRESGVGKLR